MHVGKKSSSDDKKYPSSSSMGRLKERKIIATLAAFIGGGWLTYEVVHWILVDHYHLPNILKDITIVTFLGALFSTVIWRWFWGTEKRPGNVKVEVLLVPLIILLTLVIDLKFIFVMTGVSINMLLIGIVALCLGISWVVFKSLQWAASAPEAEKKVEVLKLTEEKLISFPEAKCSIVVLPFVDMSPDKNNEYFSDGLTEEIITDLSKIRELCVISRNSAMTLKGTKKNTKTIGEELNVQFALEGSVRKVGNDLRITAQLIDAETDIHLWAEKYSGTLDDIFDIQEKVSRSIVDALKIRLSPHEDKSIAERPIDNIHAYECYLKANYEMWRGTEESLSRAITLVQEGIEVVGENELLYYALGTAYFQYVNLGINPDLHFLDKAESYVNKIFKLNSHSSYAYVLMGLINETRGNFFDALHDTKQALIHDPNNSMALILLAFLYAISGKSPSAKPLLDHLEKIDPLNNQSPWIFWWIYISEGKLDHALEVAQRMAEKDLDNPAIQQTFAWSLMMNHREKQAIEVVDRLVEKNPKHVLTSLAKFMKHVLNEDKEKAIQALSSEAIMLAKIDHIYSWYLAQFYSLLKEKEEALKWLENAVNRGRIDYYFLSEKDPFLENIRKEPRFKKLMERVKHEWKNFEV